MDEAPSLNNFLQNIIYQATSPNKPDILETSSLIAVLSLVGIIGVINYAAGAAPVRYAASNPGQNEPAGGNDLMQTLLQMAGSKKGGDINPQQMMMMMNLLSTLGKKNKNDDSESFEAAREPAF
ncbi:MAG: hypothetical protein ACM3QZ_08315 [Solirubrobacterales bacterium]